MCQDCNAAYCIAIAHLIRHPGDADGALSAASAWAESHAQPVVKQWLLVDSAAGDAAALDAVLIGLTRTAGFVRWGFTLAFAHLRRRSTYEAAVFDTLRRGGDPDTNGAIVGGLIGALHGASGGIPDYMKGPVLARCATNCTETDAAVAALPKLGGLCPGCGEPRAYNVSSCLSAHCRLLHGAFLLCFISRSSSRLLCRVLNYDAHVSYCTLT